MCIQATRYIAPVRAIHLVGTGGDVSCEYLATGSPKCTCDACLMTAPVHVALQLRAALAHERDRARRVVRVFWRVRNTEGRELASGMFGPHSFRDNPGREWERLEFVSRAIALSNQRKYGGKVYRVTVRRKVKK